MKLIVDDLAISYLDEGSGPVILMLHGWGQTAGTFEGLAADLSQDHRIVRLDLPGFGGSERPQQAWDVADFETFLKNFCDKLKLQPEVVVGHSMGGQIAVKAVGDEVLTAQKLILIAAAAVRDDRASLKNGLFRVVAKLGKTITSLPGLRSTQRRLRRKLYGVAGNSDYYAAAAAMRPTFLKLINQDVQAEAKHIKIPTLLIWGVDDIETPIEQGRKLAYAIKDSRFESVNEAGHFVYLDQPAKALAIIRNFLK